MKKIIRLTERDLTRIVKRTIKEMKFSDDEEFDSENELSSYDLCKNMGYLVHNDFATGMLTKEKVTEILYNYRLTASRYFRKKLISSEEYQEISDCYEESMSELENPEYNKLNEMDKENILKGIIQGRPTRRRDYSAEDAIEELEDYVHSNIQLGKNQLLRDMERIADSASEELSDEEYEKFMEYYDDLENQILQELPDDEEDDYEY